MSVEEVEGLYDKGRIKLSRKPKGVRAPSRVIVKFLDAEGPEDTARRKAIERVLADVRKGFDLGGEPYPKREELYDRVKRYTERDA